MKTKLVVYLGSMRRTRPAVLLGDARQEKEFRLNALKMDRPFASLLTCFLLFLAAAPAWGAVAGSISGTVRDPSGSVVPNADVTARELDTGIAHETHTDARGDLHLAGSAGGTL